MQGYFLLAPGLHQAISSIPVEQSILKAGLPCKTCNELEGKLEVLAIFKNAAIL